MAKQTKSFKRYKKNKKHQQQHIRKKKIIQKEKIKQQIKDEKLKNEEPEYESDNEQEYLKLTKKKPIPQPKENEKLTTEDVKEFLSKLGDESGSEDDDAIQELIKDAESDDDKDEIVFEHDEPSTGVPHKPVEEEEDDEEVDDEETEMQLEEGEVEDASGDIEEEEEEEDSDKTKLTKELVHKWAAKIKKSSDIEATKKLLLAFFVAVHRDDESDETKELLKDVPYTVKSQSMYLRTIVAGLKFLVMSFNSHLKRDLKTPTIPHKNSSAWKRLFPSIKTFGRTILYLLENMKNPEILSYVLKFVYDCIPYFGYSVKNSRKLLKLMLNFLGNEKESVRFRAFLNIHRMSTMFPYPFLDLCLKGVYFTLLQNSKYYNVHNFQVIDFLINCVVEMYGVEFTSSYQHAFIYIRELATTLRRALTPETNNWSLVYNHRFMISLRTWAKVLCAYPKELKELLYPLIQIILGTVHVNKNARFVPMRFKCASLLNSIVKSTGVYIPVIPILLEVLEMKPAKELPKTTAKMPIDFEFNVRLKSAQTKTREFQIRIFDEILFLILENLALHSRSIAFPEIAYPTEAYLKRYRKNKLRPSVAKKITTLLKTIKENANLILEKRSTLKYTPCDVDKASTFMGADEETPLSKLFQSENKKRAQEILARINSKMSGPSDEIAEDTDEEEEEKEAKKKKKAKKENKKRKLEENKNDEQASKKRKTKESKQPVSTSTKGPQFAPDQVEELELSD